MLKIYPCPGCGEDLGATGIQYNEVANVYYDVTIVNTSQQMIDYEIEESCPVEGHEEEAEYICRECNHTLAKTQEELEQLLKEIVKDVEE
jgi:hypothetical protein